MERWGKVFLGVCCNFGGSGERVVICLVREGIVGLIGVCDGSCVVVWYCLGHMVSGILCDLAVIGEVSDIFSMEDAIQLVLLLENFVPTVASILLAPLG